MKEPTKAQRLRAEGLLTTQGVADRLGVASATVAWWRSQNQGPKFIRLGRGKRAPIRYRLEAVEAYLAEMEKLSR